MAVRILIGDARSRLAEMPDESVHCVVTSPPYWGLRDYGVAGQLGLEPTPGEYVEAMVAVFREVRRVLRADGTLWLNLGDSYATGAGSVGLCPGGGAQGERWAGSRGYRGDRLANGREDQAAVLRQKTRATRDGSHAGKHTGMAALGPMTQPNRMPQPGLKPKDLVGVPWRIAFALQADGWWLRQDIIWSKPNPMPESVTDRCTKAHEYLFLLSKSERYHFDGSAIAEPAAYPAGNGNVFPPDDVPGLAEHNSRSGIHNIGPRDTRNRRSVWTVATQPFGEAHFATFPPALIEPCILAGCPKGGTVLDPFGGAGTTGLVSDRHGRDAILIELNPEYAAMAERRIRGDAPMFADVGSAAE